MTAKVEVNLAPSFLNQPISETICLGNISSGLSVSYTNGAGTPSYQWFSNNSNSIIGSIPISGATNSNFTPPYVAPTTVYYFCKITFAIGGCSEIVSDIAKIQINQYPLIANKNITICNSDAFFFAADILNGDIVPASTTYTWTVQSITPANAVTGASDAFMPQSTISQNLINNTNAVAHVIYTVLPKNENCNGPIFTIDITVKPSVLANQVVTNSSCFNANNGSISTNITGGVPFSSGLPYTISWSGPNGFTSSLPTISNLSPGNYSLTILDSGGCPFNDVFNIEEPTELIININLENDISCFDAANGSILISVNGGTPSYTYTWKKDNLFYAVSEDLTNLSPGFYQVYVSDANNCASTFASFTITQPDLIEINLISKTDVDCFDQYTGEINVDVIGGIKIQVAPGVFDYQYNWTGPNGFVSSNKNIVSLHAGNYTLTVTDENLCFKIFNAIIVESPEIIVNALTTPIECYGDNNATILISVSGGNAPYQISWSNLAVGFYQDNLAAGNYLITITDSLLCEKSINVNIPEAPIFWVTPLVKNISCFGANDGSINLNFIGGIAPVNLVWSDNSTAGTIRNNLAPGTYSVSIRDGKPCNIFKTFEIIEPQKLIISGLVTNAFDCVNANSGEIKLQIAGGTAPYTYNWNNGATTADLFNIPAGNYAIEVVDFNGCSVNLTFEINRHQPININVKTNVVYDCDTKYLKQSFEAQVSGGIPPYTLNWSDGIVSGSNNEFMNTNQNGTVILTTVDSYGCSKNYSYNVDLKHFGMPNFSATSYAQSVYNFHSIKDEIQFSNTATGDFESISWDFGDGSVSTETNPTHIYLDEGNYVVVQTVRYPYGCIFTHVETLIVNKGYELMLPTAFTPNNDKINDNFTPVHKGLKEIKMEVYDTWGELIFEETGQDIIGWDGTLSQTNAENGNYYCKLSAVTFYGDKIVKNIPFTLIK